MRLSVSVKMILTTTLLIVVTVVGFGKLIDVNLGKVFDETKGRPLYIIEEVLGRPEWSDRDAGMASELSGRRARRDSYL